MSKPMTIKSIKTIEHYGKRPGSRVRLFVNYQNERVIDQLVNRYKSTAQAFRKEILPNVLVGKLAGVKARWSQKAGCTCGCSPGFLLDIHPGSIGYEVIYVTIR